jgi:ketosteroid isomerase-like protein
MEVVDRSITWEQRLILKDVSRIMRTVVDDLLWLMKS